MTSTIDIPVAACEVRPGDRLVPARGNVRLVREVEHRDRSLITWPGFERMVVDDLDPHEPVTLRCPTEPTDGWDYYAGRQPGTVLPCSCIYRRGAEPGNWVRAITVPGCAWCDPSDEED
ncbi:hypothetical protein [Dactylosporangium sp. CA-139066]|uniref:hypothetical protein n=1 Tax=Dactylosporangium sp. CA-139066 TaxID=3239930 RepID=UPI003D943C09